MTHQNEATKTSRSGKETKDKKDIRVEDRRGGLDAGIKINNTKKN